MDTQLPHRAEAEFKVTAFYVKAVQLHDYKQSCMHMHLKMFKMLLIIVTSNTSVIQHLSTN